MIKDDGWCRWRWLCWWWIKSSKFKLRHEPLSQHARTQVKRSWGKSNWRVLPICCYSYAFDSSFLRHVCVPFSPTSPEISLDAISPTLRRFWRFRLLWLYAADDDNVLTWSCLDVWRGFERRIATIASFATRLFFFELLPSPSLWERVLLERSGRDLVPKRCRCRWEVWPLLAPKECEA